VTANSSQVFDNNGTRMTEQATSQVPSLLKAPDAFARMNAAGVRETFAHSLGVQAATWGMQWVKAGQALRRFSEPLPSGHECSA
jgi:hypothetical protein